MVTRRRGPCVNVTVFPAIVAVPLRPLANDGLAWMVIVALPELLPEPLAVIHAALLAAVQAHPEVVVTVMEPVSPNGDTVAVVTESAYEQTGGGGGGGG